MKNVCWVFIILYLVSCKKDISQPSIVPYDLIVEGGINTLTARQFLRLTKPAEKGESKVEPISGADVNVSMGGYKFIFKETKVKGIYSAFVKENNSYDSVYTLHIIYRGRSYQAADTLQYGLPIDASYLPLTIKRGADAQVVVPKHFFGVLYPQQWIIMPQKYVWDASKFNLNNDFSYSHVFGTPDALNPLIQLRRTFNLGLRDSIVVYKFSMSFSRSKYLYQLFQETDWRGLLSSTPSNIKGNISGNANGYFYATDVDTKKVCVRDIR